jgi:hypothetical protein
MYLLCNNTFRRDQKLSITTNESGTGARRRYDWVFMLEFAESGGRARVAGDTGMRGEGEVGAKGCSTSRYETVFILY